KEGEFVDLEAEFKPNILNSVLRNTIVQVLAADFVGCFVVDRLCDLIFGRGRAKRLRLSPIFCWAMATARDSDEFKQEVTVEGHPLYTHRRSRRRSPGVRAYVTHMDQMVMPVLSHVTQILTAFPGKPLFILGHSMGGLLLCWSGHWLPAAEQHPDLAIQEEIMTDPLQFNLAPGWAPC
uniref:Hydrolase_4 domain-containing protein n=1 Tax=Macrostomum lignano TaxID=282301 RepID=A0A1I8FFV0_9PLAT